ncbi:hypothetical protein T01_540 [Trichinella spiralis]|uniref:Uncharacterized protein n=1 Tax=Trichinella spiralis TaxID=6334 RepID=A0A0V1BNE2_TRISP|nr:hypothetical protein T01_540 [Trichinella spiralis]
MLATQICQLAVDCILNDFQRAVQIDTQQSRRAVVDAMKTITNRSFVCDARTPLYHALAHDKMRKKLNVLIGGNTVPIMPHC